MLMSRSRKLPWLAANCETHKHIATPETRTATHIPPELVDLIIDHSHSDKNTLATCSLVSKAWLPASRYHLFSGVKLQERDTLSFCALLASPLSTIPPAVCRVAMIRNWSRGDGHDIIPHLTALGAVTSLFMTQGGGFMPRDLPSALRLTFSSIVRLELSGFWFDRLEEVVELICSFPLLEELGLCISWQRKIPLTSSRHHLPCHLNALHITSSAAQTQDLLKWFSSHEPAPAIRTISLSNVGSRVVPSIGPCLRTIGNSLQQVTLDFLDGATKAVLAGKTDLVRDESRRSEIDSNAIKNGVGLSRDILAQICAPAMETVNLSFWFSSMNTLEGSPWADLDDVLSLSDFSNLERINISGNGGEAEIRERLPICHARGILRVWECSTRYVDMYPGSE